MLSPQASAKAIQPPWIGIFPVRTPAPATHHQAPSPPPLPQPQVLNPLLAGSQSSQLLFTENDHHHQSPLPPTTTTLPANHPRPTLYVVMQEAAVGDAVIVEGADKSLEGGLKTEKDNNNASTTSTANISNKNKNVLDRHFDISLLKLDHISFTDKASSSSTAKVSEGEESPYDILGRYLERNRKREEGRNDVDTNNSKVGKESGSGGGAPDMLMPVTVLWRGRTSLSKMCPVDIQQALNANNGTNTTSTSSSSSQLGFLRAYGSLVEEILMNRSSNNKDNSATTTTTPPSTATKNEPFATTVAQKVVADAHNLAAQQRHASKSNQPKHVTATNTTNVVDAFFHLKAEEVEDVDGGGGVRHQQGTGNIISSTSTAIGEEADGFLGFLRNHGITSPIATNCGAPQSPDIDPLTTLLKHAYGLVRNATKSNITSTTGTATIVKQLSDQDNIKTTIKRSDSGGGDGSFTGGGSSGGATIEAIRAMRRHRYMFLKNALGLVGGDRGDEAVRPSLLFTVSPEEILHAPLSYQQASGLPISTMLPSVVTLEIRIATMSGGGAGGDLSSSGHPQQTSSSSSVGDGPRSYLPFANVHCFLDPSHRTQVDQMSTASSSSSTTTPSTSPPTIRHPIGGFLSMLCGAFLHHNQLSEEVLPSLLAAQHALISNCFLPLASTTLTREAELLATFETILNAKKAKIREVVDEGVRAQRRSEDLEALVVRLQERNNILEQQLRNGGRHGNNNNNNNNEDDNDDDGESSQGSENQVVEEEVLEVAPQQQLLLAQSAATLSPSGISQQLHTKVCSPPRASSGDIQAAGQGGLLLAAAATSPPCRKASVSSSSNTPKIVKGEKRVRDVTDDDWIQDTSVVPPPPPSTTTPQSSNLPPPGGACAQEEEEDDLLALLN